ncbi:MAG: hypothetical protein ACXAE3_00260 [Candidatus Kariarchaeaceae archaeon]|jgi:hypothetical protein
MVDPWWSVLAISEDPTYILAEDQRFFAMMAMLVTFIIITPQLIYNLYRLRASSSFTGSHAERNYTMMYVGVYSTFLNSFLLRLSIYQSDGQFSVFAQEKAVLFVIGISTFTAGLVFVAFSIINFRTRTKKIIFAIFIAFISIAGTVVITQTMIIFGNTTVVTLSLTLQALASVLGVIFLFIFISSFLFEMTYDPSKMEKLRLVLLSIGVSMMALQLVSVAIAGVAKRFGNPELFINTSTYLIPLSYLIGQPIMYLVFHWSLFTPTWLLMRARIIQPSLRGYLQNK